MDKMGITDIQESASKAKATYGGGMALSIAMTAAAHPLTYVKVLIQVGHEPMPPTQTTTFFGKKVWRLPHFLQYAGHIRSIDGWLGLYRGLGPRIIHNIVTSTVTNAVTDKMKKENDAADKLSTDKNPVKEFLQETCNLAVAKTAGCVVSYPFQVISIRMMVQFIGRETQYSNIFSSIKEIYQEEGIAGFFSGLIPHLISELLALWMFRTMNYIVINYVVGDDYKQMSEVKSYSQGISQYISSMLTYPFQLVSNIMSINDTNLAAGNPPLMPIYSSWGECWVELGKKGLRNRGSTLFRRTVIS